MQMAVKYDDQVNPGFSPSEFSGGTLEADDGRKPSRKILGGIE